MIVSEVLASEILCVLKGKRRENGKHCAIERHTPANPISIVTPNSFEQRTSRAIVAMFNPTDIVRKTSSKTPRHVGTRSRILSSLIPVFRVLCHFFLDRCGRSDGGLTLEIQLTAADVRWDYVIPNSLGGNPRRRWRQKTSRIPSMQGQFVESSHLMPAPGPCPIFIWRTLIVATPGTKIAGQGPAREIRVIVPCVRRLSWAVDAVRLRHAARIMDNPVKLARSS